MKSKKRITPAQEKNALKYREKWVKIASATGEADIEKIRPSINAIYQEVGKEPPFIWQCESPLTAQIIINVLTLYGAELNNIGFKSYYKVFNGPRGKLDEKVKSAFNNDQRMIDDINRQFRDRGEAFEVIKDAIIDYLWKKTSGGWKRDDLPYQIIDSVIKNLNKNVSDNFFRHKNLIHNGKIMLGKISNFRSLPDYKDSYCSTMFFGSQEARIIAGDLFPNKIKKCFSKEDLAAINRFVIIAKNAFWFYMFENICFVCDRPSFVGTDDQGQLHATDRGAVEFSDGFKLYYLHGCQVPSFVIENPDEITDEVIQNTHDILVRRIMLEKFGWDKYLNDCEFIGENAYGALYRKKNRHYGKEYIQYGQNRIKINTDRLKKEFGVLIINKNDPEIYDGSYQRYLIYVPAEIKTIHRAVEYAFKEMPGMYNYLIGDSFVPDPDFDIDDQFY